MELAASVVDAHARIRDHVLETPLLASPELGAGRCDVLLKLENRQATGSFKLRGATNKLMSLPPAVRARGVVAASTGNHGAGIARAAQSTSTHAVVFAPLDAEPSKLERIRGYGAEVRLVGDDCLVAERAAREMAESSGGTYVSPYNDAVVIAGQGTVGLEIERATEPLDAVFVAVGGGGLISGVAGYLKSTWPEIRVFGCSPENSAVMAASIAAGRILDLPSDPTLSDATAGGVEDGAVTFPVCQRVIDEFVLVDEEAIRRTHEDMLAWHPEETLEGAAAMTVAAFRSVRERLSGARVGIVLCGGNVSGPLRAARATRVAD